jgi:hypothetical protein
MSWKGKSDGKPRYMFIWESTSDPGFHVEMNWGRDDPPNDFPSPLPEDQAMAEWDAILPTLDWRPGSKPAP